MHLSSLLCLLASTLAFAAPSYQPRALSQAQLVSQWKDATVWITSRAAPNYAIAMPGYYNQTGLQLQGVQKAQAWNQWWTMRYMAATSDWQLSLYYYKPTVVDLAGSNPADNTAVLSWPNSGSANQRWVLENVVENGNPTQYYRFRNSASGTYLDFYGGSNSVGSSSVPIIGWHYSDYDMAIQWSLIDTGMPRNGTNGQ